MSLIENALVVLFDGRRAYWGYTDETGKVSLSGIPPGSYKLAVLKEGYYGYVADVVVDEDESFSITISKPPEVICKTELTVETLSPYTDVEASISTEVETE